jgi:hypothetical protein
MILKYGNYYFEMRARLGPGPALDRTLWPGPS